MNFFKLICFLLIVNKCVQAQPFRVNVLPVHAASTQNQSGYIRVQALLNNTCENIIENLNQFGRLAMPEEQIREIYNEVLNPGTALTCSDSDSDTETCSDTEVDDYFSEQIEHLMNERRDWTLDEIAERLEICIGKVIKLLQKINYTLVDTILVPHQLNQTQLQDRVTRSQSNINFSNDYPNFLNNIISIDEFWLRSYDPSTSEQEWRLPNETPPTQAQISIGDYKVMVIAAVYQGRVIAHRILPRDDKITGEFVLSFIQTELKEYIDENLKDVQRFWVLLDDAGPHRWSKLQTYLTLNFGAVELPPYSPDLNPCDFDTFKRLKSLIPNKKAKLTKTQLLAALKSTIDIINNDPKWSRNQLFDRWKYVVDHKGDYFPGAKSQITKKKI